MSDLGEGSPKGVEKPKVNHTKTEETSIKKRINFSPLFIKAGLTVSAVAASIAGLHQLNPNSERHTESQARQAFALHVPSADAPQGEQEAYFQDMIGRFIKTANPGIMGPEDGTVKLIRKEDRVVTMSTPNNTSGQPMLINEFYLVTENYIDKKPHTLLILNVNHGNPATDVSDFGLQGHIDTNGTIDPFDIKDGGIYPYDKNRIKTPLEKLVPLANKIFRIPSSASLSKETFDNEIEFDDTTDGVDYQVNLDVNGWFSFNAVDLLVPRP